MSALLDRMKGAGTIKGAEVLTNASFFKNKSMTNTKIPIINMAFSGDADGGMTSGITIISGESKSFKTLLTLYCLKAYMEENKDAVCLFYDSEFGTTPEYLSGFGIDTDKVLHIPIENVEQLKFDAVKRLEEIKKGDKVFILVDSLGSLASKKEVEDALDEKSVTDMTRAKAIRSFFRIITPHITMKDIPCFIINHVYKTLEMFSKDVIPGGTAVTYAANQIFIITKAQEKDGTELTGYKFTINIHKSRIVKEKSKFPLIVTFEKGINKWSGLFDVALEGGFITKATAQLYCLVDKTTGEVLEANKFKRKDKEYSSAFWADMLKPGTGFSEYIKSEFKLATSLEISEEVDIDSILEEDE